MRQVGQAGLLERGSHGDDPAVCRYLELSSHRHDRLGIRELFSGQVADLDRGVTGDRRALSRRGRATGAVVARREDQQREDPNGRSADSHHRQDDQSKAQLQVRHAPDREDADVALDALVSRSRRSREWCARRGLRTI